jgi:hypothetical protein
MAFSTASTLGEANRSPHTAAVSIPLPTNPACAGSWPEPPPEITATRLLSQSPRATILMAGSISSLTRLACGAEQYAFNGIVDQLFAIVKEESGHSFPLFCEPYAKA